MTPPSRPSQLLRPQAPPQASRPKEGVITVASCMTPTVRFLDGVVCVPLSRGALSLQVAFITAGMVVERKPCVRGKKSENAMRRSKATACMVGVGVLYSITTFMREITPLLQIRQVAQLRSTTCNLQGLSPTQRSTQTTPSRNLTLGVMQLVTLRSPETAGRYHPCLPLRRILIAEF